MRVPPDQSGIAAAALRQCQVGIGHGERPGEARQARGEHEGLGTRCSHRAVQQVEVGRVRRAPSSPRCRRAARAAGVVAWAGGGRARRGRRPGGGSGAAWPAGRGRDRPGGARARRLRRGGGARGSAASRARMPASSSAVSDAKLVWRSRSSVLAAARTASGSPSSAAPGALAVPGRSEVPPGRPPAPGRRSGAGRLAGGGSSGAFGSPRASVTSTTPRNTWAKTRSYTSIWSWPERSVTRPAQ